MHFGWIVTNQNKKPKIRTLHFEIATYRVLHERNNDTVSFKKYLKFQEKNDFYTLG